MIGFWNSGSSLGRVWFTAAMLLAAVPAAAQQPGQLLPMASSKSTTAGKGAMMQAMDQMQQAMAVAPETGNTDHDFVAMMIPHHQGAIDMAKVELADGKDPVLRAMAQNIISSQAKQVHQLTYWQAQHPSERQ